MVYDINIIRTHNIKPKIKTVIIFLIVQSAVFLKLHST